MCGTPELKKKARSQDTCHPPADIAEPIPVVYQSRVHGGVEGHNGPSAMRQRHSRYTKHGETICNQLKGGREVDVDIGSSSRVQFRDEHNSLTLNHASSG